MNNRTKKKVHKLGGEVGISLIQDIMNNTIKKFGFKKRINKATIKQTIDIVKGTSKKKK